MANKESHQDDSSTFESIDSNASTCSTRTNLSRSLELTLSPLIDQLVSSTSQEVSDMRSVCRQKEMANRPVSVLLQALDQSVGHLAQKAEEIAYGEEGRDQSRMLSAVHRLKGSARQLKERVINSSLPSSRANTDAGREGTVREAARSLLYDVASVLSVADRLDMKRLVETSQSVESWLERLRHVSSVQELYGHIRQFTPVMARLTKLAKQRQEELDCCEENTCLVESLSWYRRELAVGCSLLIPSLKCYMKHHDLQTSRSNRDFALEVILNAANNISRIVKENFVPPPFSLERAGELHQHIHSLQFLQLLPRDEAARSEASQLIGELVEKAESLAELVSTRDAHRQKLVDFIARAQRMTDSGSTEEHTSGEALDRLCEDLCEAAELSNLDALLELHALLRDPLLAVQTAARSSDVTQLQEAVDSFFQLMERIRQVSENISVSCPDPAGARLVTLSSQQLTRLASQLSHAARSHSQRPRSRAAWRCLLSVAGLWERELCFLLDSLDAVTPLAEFVKASQTHIAELSAGSLRAVEGRDLDVLTSHRDGISASCSRLLSIIEGCLTDGELEVELETQHSVFSMLSALRGQMFKFDEEMNKIEIFLYNSPQSSYQDIGSYELVSHRICELVLDIKSSLLEMLEGEESVPCESLGSSDLRLSDSKLSYENKSELRGYSYRKLSRSRSSAFSNVETEVQVILKNLSPPEKSRLESARQEFQVQQVRLESAVAKWDETENDVIFLAKDMCVMMTDISDFTKGEGPIHTPNDLIETASELTRSSQHLGDLISRVIELCRDSNSNADLRAYLGELKLYAHQIKMVSKVYVDLTQIRLNTDSISSIVISSKNLLNAVVKLVMASYIACNKIAKSAESQGHSQSLRLIKWKMRPPNKKPLCRSSSVYSISSTPSHASRPGTGRRSSSRPGYTPTHVLDAFEVEEGEGVAFV